MHFPPCALLLAKQWVSGTEKQATLQLDGLTGMRFPKRIHGIPSREMDPRLACSRRAPWEGGALVPRLGGEVLPHPLGCGQQGAVFMPPANQLGAHGQAMRASEHG